jgi:hypothetical protein
VPQTSVETVYRRPGSPTEMVEVVTSVPAAVDAHLNEYTVRSYRRAGSESGSPADPAAGALPEVPPASTTPSRDGPAGAGAGAAVLSRYLGTNPPPLLRTRQLRQRPAAPAVLRRRAVLSEERYNDIMIMASATAWLAPMPPFGP